MILPFVCGSRLGHWPLCNGLVSGKQALFGVNGTPMDASVMMQDQEIPQERSPSSCKLSEGDQPMGDGLVSGKQALFGGNGTPMDALVMMQDQEIPQERSPSLLSEPAHSPL